MSIGEELNVKEMTLAVVGAITIAYMVIVGVTGQGIDTSVIVESIKAVVGLI